VGGRMVRYSLLSLLYCIQGAPYGFQTSCLPLLLRQAGLSFSSLSAMKLLFLPWVCKPLYTPLLERTRSLRWWLVSSLAAMAASCLLAALLVGEQDLRALSLLLILLNLASLLVGEQDLRALSLLLILLNLASAAQDVCVDSLALTILLPSELGAGNTIQVVAYKVGAVGTGSLLLWVHQVLGWASMWLVFALLYTSATLLTLLAVPDLQGSPGEQEEVEERRKEKLEVGVVMEDLRKVWRVPHTPSLVTFVLFYKLAERGENLIPLYLVDKQVSLSSLSLWSGLVRSVASVGGSALAGYLLSARSVRPSTVLRWSAWGRVAPLVAQVAVVAAWGAAPVAATTLDTVLYALALLSLTLSSLAAGLLTTSCFTLMMEVSRSAPPSLRASHYTLAATMEVAGKLAMAAVSGAATDLLGLRAVLVGLVVLGLATPGLVPGLEGGL